MTMLAPSLDGDALARAQLGAAPLRRSLTSMLRRRVPAAEAEDLAQTVLCDALAAPSVPSDPEELRRWIAGIARHKVADFHRRARTRAAFHEAAPELSASPPPFEAREVLVGVARETLAAERDRETLEWLVREHGGERLADIATERGLPSPVVRQRVSRFRRALRERWGALLGLLLAVGGVGALASRAHERGAIVADPSASAEPSAPAARLLALAQGTWRVEQLVIDPEVDAPERVLLELEGRTAEVQIRGTQITVRAKTGSLTRTLDVRFEGSADTASIALMGPLQHATARFSPGDGTREHARWLVRIHDGRARGTLVLVRP